jgi:hypothetical protein
MEAIRLIRFGRSLNLPGIVPLSIVLVIVVVRTLIVAVRLNSVRAEPHPTVRGGAKGVSQQFLTNRNRRTGRSREAFQIVVRPRFSSSNRYRDRHILIVATSSNRLRRSFALRFVSPLELGIRKQGSMPADGTFRRIGLLFFITLTLHHSMNEQVQEIASFPALLVAFLHRSTILIDDNHCSQTFRGKPGGRSGGANRSAANWSHQCLITGVSKRACVTPLPTG